MQRSEGPEGQNSQEVHVTLGLRWTRGALRMALAAVLTAAGGVWAFWDRIAEVLAIAPVAAFLAILTCFPLDAAFAAGSPEATHSIIFRAYGNIRPVSPCAGPLPAPVSRQLPPGSSPAASPTLGGCPHDARPFFSPNLG